MYRNKRTECDNRARVFPRFSPVLYFFCDWLTKPLFNRQCVSGMRLEETLPVTLHVVGLVFLNQNLQKNFQQIYLLEDLFKTP